MYKCFKCGRPIPQGKEMWQVDVGWKKIYPLCERCDERMTLAHDLW